MKTGFTARAVVFGAFMGSLFGCAIVYLTLRSGLSISASIPAAIFSLGLFKLLRSKHIILESLYSQTAASISISVASVTCFTVPAVFLMKSTISYWHVVAVVISGCLLGIFILIPLRKGLVENSPDLPFPEGTACAAVLKSAVAGSGAIKWLTAGLLAGGGFEIAGSIFNLFPEECVWMPGFLPKALLAVSVSPAMIGIGYILGYRGVSVLTGGTLLSSLFIFSVIGYFGKTAAVAVLPSSMLIADMQPMQIWSSYLRYIGMGALVFAGVVMLLKMLPEFKAMLFENIRMIKKNSLSAERGDVNIKTVAMAIGALALVFALMPGAFYHLLTVPQQVLLTLIIIVCAIVFVLIAGRIAGMVGVSSQPVSCFLVFTVFIIATLFTFLGWNEQAMDIVILLATALVCGAIASSGDMSQDFKTGYLVGATPKCQSYAQLFSVVFAAFSSVTVLFIVAKTYSIGGAEVPAPQATLIKTMIDGGLTGNLNWELFFMGVSLGVVALLLGISPMLLSMGVFLPVSTVLPMFFGGVVQRLAHREGGADSEMSAPVLLASGLVAGEGLAGIASVLLLQSGLAKSPGEPLLHGVTGNIAALGVSIVICAILFYSAREKPAVK